MLSHSIPLFKVFMPESVTAPLLETLFSGYVGQGIKVEEFEKCLSDYIGNPYALTVNSCTSGLQLALRLSDVGPGDEVISTPMTCSATNMAIMASGAKIVWANIDPVSGNIDPFDIRKKVTVKTKAIMMVHWGGYPCEIEEINIIAQHYGIKVIEDAAQAMGAEYKGRKIGNHSDFIAFSFQAVKNMTTIDGGALFCRDKADYEKGKRLRWYGLDRKLKNLNTRHECEQNIAEWGYKFHMNDICACIGVEQLKYLDLNIETCRKNASFYSQMLADIDGIVTIPIESEVRQGSYPFYTMHVVRNKEDFKEYMYNNGIMVSQVHARNDSHLCFKEFDTELLKGVDDFTRTMICIPSGWWVDKKARNTIVAAAKDFFRSA